MGQGKGDLEGVRGRADAVYSSFFFSAPPFLIDLTKSSYAVRRRQLSLGKREVCATETHRVLRVVGRLDADRRLEELAALGDDPVAAPVRSEISEQQ